VFSLQETGQYLSRVSMPITDAAHGKPHSEQTISFAGYDGFLTAVSPRLRKAFASGALVSAH
jgi:hypothetical protein